MFFISVGYKNYIETHMKFSYNQTNYYMRFAMDKFVNDLLTEDILKEVSKRYDVKRENLYFVGGFENYIYVERACFLSSDEKDS